MKLKKPFFIVLIGIIALIIITAVFVTKSLKKDIWDKNEALLRNSIVNQLKSGDSIDLSKFTPFDWNTMYSFTPYTPIEKVYGTIGYKWDSISETVNEGMNQIVFTKEGMVVCYIYGYGENNGYGFFIPYDTDKAVRILYAKDKPTFSVKKDGNVVYLEYD